MKPLKRAIILATVAGAVTVGCGHSDADHALTVASELVTRLITADTLEQYELVAADGNWSECGWVWSGDITRPVRAVRIIDQNQTGSLVVTRVEYTVLGRARGGEGRAGFQRDVSRDTVSISVAVDADGNGTIQCGDHNFNHSGLTIFLSDWLPYLDSASRDEWEAALVEAER